MNTQQEIDRFQEVFALTLRDVTEDMPSLPAAQARIKSMISETRASQTDLQPRQYQLAVQIIVAALLNPRECLILHDLAHLLII